MCVARLSCVVFVIRVILNRALDFYTFSAPSDCIIMMPYIIQIQPASAYSYLFCHDNIAWSKNLLLRLAALYGSPSKHAHSAWRKRSSDKVKNTDISQRQTIVVVQLPYACNTIHSLIGTGNIHNRALAWTARVPGKWAWSTRNFMACWTIWLQRYSARASGFSWGIYAFQTMLQSNVKQNLNRLTRCPASGITVTDATLRPPSRL